MQAAFPFLFGCVLACNIPAAWADRQAVLGTVNADGSFATGRSAGDASDGVIKEAEMRIQADTAAEHRLDAKTYHLRADCWGDVLIPLGKFASGALSINWSADGGGASIGGQLMVVAHSGEQADSGPYILSQSGAGLDRVKLRAVKVGGGASDQYYLFLQYDDAASTGPNSISVAITTTANIVEEYSESSGATAAVLSVFSSIGSESKLFDFHQDVFINSSKALTEATAPAAISSQLTSGGYLTRTYGANTWLGSGGLLALGENSQAYGSNAIAIGGGMANGDAAVSISGGSANGALSLAMGQSQASGYGAVAMGAANASGDFSIATGNSSASGYASASLNTGLATGDYSTAMGGAYATGFGSTAMGGGSAQGIGATAMGSGQALGNFSLAAGEGTIAQAYGAVAMGSYNASQGTSDAWIQTDDLLVIGNGGEFTGREFAKLKDLDVNTVDVFYVPFISPGGVRASAYYSARNNTGSAIYNNWIVVSAAEAAQGAPNTLPHELMHILLNSGHRMNGLSPKDPGTALFRPMTWQTKDVSGSKRIGPNPDATDAGSGEADTTTMRANAETLP